MMLGHYLWLSVGAREGNPESTVPHISSPLSCHQLFPPGIVQAVSIHHCFPSLLTLSLLPSHSVSLSFCSPLNALIFSLHSFFLLLSHFLLFDITPFVPVVTGPSLPGGDRCSHSHSDIIQSISEGGKLSFKLPSPLKWRRKRKKSHML